MRKSSWSWRRRIEAAARETWVARLAAAGGASWAIVEKPGAVRILLEAWADSRAGAAELARKWGGQVRAVKMRQWLDTKPAPPTRIGRRLEIAHDAKRTRGSGVVPRLVIPHGVAFGSGEHATTFMLLRALAARGRLESLRVLDLGTGSGVLALAARLFGATKIVATDFDKDAVRTARANEAMNFSKPLIRWKCADARRLATAVRYDLVLANLFSGILVEAAPRVAGCVADGGALWLSGVLVSQQDEVIAAYRGEGMELVRVSRRGKWVMIAFAKARRPGRSSATT